MRWATPARWTSYSRYLSAVLHGQRAYVLRACVRRKGLGPSTTLAWPGWKQPDIAVKVDTARLNTSRFKNSCEKCVLLNYPSTEFKSAFNVYWHGEGAARLSCIEPSIWEFPFLRGACWQGENSIWYCVNGMPQKDTLDNVAYTCMLPYPIVVSHLRFNFLCLCYFSVSISVVRRASVLYVPVSLLISFHFIVI